MEQCQTVCLDVTVCNLQEFKNLLVYQGLVKL